MTAGSAITGGGACGPRGRTGALVGVSGLIADAGERASRLFAEFFTANIRNKNTRAAYARAEGFEPSRA